MERNPTATQRRVILVHWKMESGDTSEIFSSLKAFCACYPSYSYNTLSNYLSKQRTAYENDEVRVERKSVISGRTEKRKLIPVVRKGKMADINEEEEDVQYWLSRPAKERIAAVTFLVRQSGLLEARMDKSLVYKGKRK